jgi:hypothetical protein
MPSAPWRSAWLIIPLIGAAGLLWWYSRRDHSGPTSEQLAMFRRAVAELEQLHVAEANEQFAKLLAFFPNDEGLLRNRLIGNLVEIDQSLRAIESGTDAQATERAESNLPELMERSEGFVNELRTVAANSEATEWLAARLSLLRANRLPAGLATKLREATATQLLAQIEQFPERLTLVGPLDDLLQPIDDAALQRRAVDALAKSSDRHPRNLYVALLAAQKAVQERSPSAIPLLERIRELGQPLAEQMDPELRSEGGTAEELMQRCADLSRDGQWDECDGLLIAWNNVALGTQAYRTDRKAAAPNALDWISFDLEQRLLEELPERPPVQLAPLQYARESIADMPDASLIRWLDFDLAGPLELAALKGSQLQIFQRTGGQWQLVAEAATTPDATCWAIADLYVVDSSSPDRLRRSITSTDTADAASQSRWHDTYQALIVGGPQGVSVHRMNPLGTQPAERLLEPARPTGLEDIRGISNLTVADIDADGDLDLILATTDGPSPIQIWINRGNATFYSTSQHSQLPPPEMAITDLVAADLDRDLDIDILLADAQGQIGLLENMLHQQFRWQPLAWEGIRGSGLAVQEFDGNVSWDLAASSDDRTVIQLTRMTDRFSIQPLRQVSVGTPGGRSHVADIDNSGTRDLISWGSSGVHVIRAPSPANWNAAERLFDDPAKSVAIGDQDEDGRLDLAISTATGLYMLRSDAPLGHFLSVRVKGIDDNATGRVNHFAIGSTIEVRSGPQYQAQIIDSPSTHFGLGSVEQADSLRIILTNGATQSVTQPRADQLLREQQELKGSCPYLYAWDGKQFAFVTDCLWAAPLGLQVSRGKVAPDRPWEYLMFPGELLQPIEGKYELRLTEELWEIAYLDCLRLMAVDHPADSQLFTNEKVGPPSIASPHLFVLSERHPVPQAVDARGTDLTDAVRHLDQRFAVPYRQRYCQGLAEPHHVEITLDKDTASKRRIMLLLTGWILPTDTSLNIQIDQNPDWPRLQHPVLQVPSADGGWRDALVPMGFPGGKTKSIVVDLSDVLVRDDPRLRITTTAMIHWDQIEVATDEVDRPSISHELPLQSAELQAHGFSRLEPRSSSQPHRYLYDQAWQGPRWAPIEGPMTAYGPCEQLLEDWDDLQVVMVGGDELRLRFDAPQTPVPDGWKRDFVIYLVGWDKDADLNTLTGQSTLPLPFRGMKSYPPMADQLPTAQDVLERNRSHLTREQPFRRFWNANFESPPLDWSNPGP